MSYNGYNVLNAADLDKGKYKLVIAVDANFNNEGSEGEIIIDLDNEKMSIDNYWIIYDKQSTGLVTFEE